MVPEFSPTSLPIVVGIDGKAVSRAALRWAVEAARLHERRLHLILVADEPHTSWYFPYTPPRAGETFHLQRPIPEHPSTEDLEAALAFARLRLPAGNVSGSRAPGHATTTLIEGSHDAEMLVVGSRQRGPVASATLGSVSATVAARAGCPVVVVRPDHVEANGGAEEKEGRPVVAGVEDDLAADAVLDFAFRDASSRGRRLSVVNCQLDLFGGLDESAADFARVRARLADRIAVFRARYPDVAVAIRMADAEPADELAAASEGAELLVVGSRGRGRVSGLILGSVSQRLLHDAHAPVAIVHPARRRPPLPARTRMSTHT